MEVSKAVPAFGGGERGPCLGPRAKGGLALVQMKNGNGLLRKNINLLIQALSPCKEVKPSQLSGKLVKSLPPNVIL